MGIGACFPGRLTDLTCFLTTTKMKRISIVTTYESGYDVGAPCFEFDAPKRRFPKIVVWGASNRCVVCLVLVLAMMRTRLTCGAPIYTNLAPKQA